jgi:hypothetical protein
MRHATWLRLEASPLWRDLYGNYRRLPDGIRAPLRALLMPHWHLSTLLVRTAARHRVVAGPFHGMRIQLSGLSSRHLLGYILGSQELELREVIRRIIGRGYGTIVNVGAADGYYAVGLALRSSSSCVEAFEALGEFHPLIERSARLNGVSTRIALRGMCDANALRQSLQSAKTPALVLMDIEGGEVDLLDPRSIPQLQRTDILVETHDAFVAHATDTLIDRFWETHQVECYTAQARTLSDFPADFLPTFRRWFPRLAVDLMDERRPGIQRWLFLTAKRPDGGGRPGDGAPSTPAVG